MFGRTMVRGLLAAVLTVASAEAAHGGDIFVTCNLDPPYASGVVAEYTTSGTLVSNPLVSNPSTGWYGIAVSGNDLFVTGYVANAVGGYTTSGDCKRLASFRFQ